MHADFSDTDSRPGRFETTHWSLVLASQSQESSSADQRFAALSQLCRIYWRPLYVYLRRCGHEAVDAEDLTQGFLGALLKRDAFDTVAQERGRFRSFLIASLKNYLSHHREKEGAQKRGGGKWHLSLSDPRIEAALQSELMDSASPELAYEKRWAMTLLDRVRSRLRGEYLAGGKEGYGDELMPFLPGGHATRSQGDIAAALGISVSAVKSEVYRLRQRFGQYLRAEVANTVSDPSEIDGELEYLIQVLR